MESIAPSLLVSHNRRAWSRGGEPCTGRLCPFDLAHEAGGRALPATRHWPQRGAEAWAGGRLV